MNIGLFNLEPQINNTALMKISSYHKNKGDKVWDCVLGSGVITRTELDYQYSITAAFDGQTTELHKVYLSSGKQFPHHLSQSLFYYEDRPIVIKMDDLEIPKKCDRVNLDENGFLEFHTDINNFGCSHIYVDFKNYNEEEYTRKVRREK